MGVSSKFLDSHIKKFESEYLNYRNRWPSHLFRHEPFTNAVEILRSGVLISRHSAAGKIPNDIAPTEIIHHTDIVHNRVRLYFRPRTPTQYHIEGIRKASEYYMNRHAGMLVKFVFDSRKILTDEETLFSDGNMQSSHSSILNGDQSFSRLDFDRIYHDSAHHDQEITRIRCAEVLPVSPMQISDSLKKILVRSDAERETLITYLSNTPGSAFILLLEKAVGPGVFFGRHTCVEYVDVVGSRINFKLGHSVSGLNISTRIILMSVDNRKLVLDSKEMSLEYYKNWYWEPRIEPGHYWVQFILENCIAYEKLLPVGF